MMYLEIKNDCGSRNQSKKYLSERDDNTIYSGRSLVLINLDELTVNYA